MEGRPGERGREARTGRASTVGSRSGGGGGGLGSSWGGGGGAGLSLEVGRADLVPSENTIPISAPRPRPMISWQSSGGGVCGWRADQQLRQGTGSNRREGRQAYFEPALYRSALVADFSMIPSPSYLAGS